MGHSAQVYRELKDWWVPFTEVNRRGSQIANMRESCNPRTACFKSSALVRNISNSSYSDMSQTNILKGTGRKSNAKY